eukprot:SAG31_NODE_4661_length_3058_cov_2.518756_5_plen_74_part_00
MAADGISGAAAATSVKDRSASGHPPDTPQPRIVEWYSFPILVHALCLSFAALTISPNVLSAPEGLLTFMAFDI